jgi:hypothetical protein
MMYTRLGDLFRQRQITNLLLAKLNELRARPSWTFRGRDTRRRRYRTFAEAFEHRTKQGTER